MTRYDEGTNMSWQRWGYLAVAIVLVVAFTTGGSASAHSAGDLLGQWLALPLAISAVLVVQGSPATGLRRAAYALALVIVTLLAFQQLPLPEGLWRSMAVRAALADDLQAGGVSQVRHAWSLSPMASERGLWSIFPALALFLGAIALPARHHRRLLVFVVALCTASIALAVIQMGAVPGEPIDRLFNPYSPSGHPAFNGFFANPNHQALALAVSIVIIAALLVSSWQRQSTNAAVIWERLGLAAIAVVSFSVLPMTGSRAAFLLAVLGLIAVTAMLRPGRRLWAGSEARVRFIKALFGLFALATVVVVVAWLRYDMLEGVRWSVAKASLALGWANAPLGAGVGSFVEWFGQAAPAELTQRPYYFNHAHNEYAQWWLESGVLGAVPVLGALGLLAYCHPMAPTAAQSADRGVAVAAWLGCVMMLMQSGVDFPLRTPALMAVAGLLAGIVVGQGHARRLRGDNSVPAPTSRRPD